MSYDPSNWPYPQTPWLYFRVAQVDGNEVHVEVIDSGTGAPLGGNSALEFDPEGITINYGRECSAATRVSAVPPIYRLDFPGPDIENGEMLFVRAWGDAIIGLGGEVLGPMIYRFNLQ